MTRGPGLRVLLSASRAGEKTFDLVDTSPQATARKRNARFNFMRIDSNEKGYELPAHLTLVYAVDRYDVQIKPLVSSA